MLSDDSKKRRRAEDVLIESEGFAWKVLNASLNGIYIYDVKLGQNVFINKQYTTWRLWKIQRFAWRSTWFQMASPPWRFCIVRVNMPINRGRT